MCKHVYLYFNTCFSCFFFVGSFSFVCLLHNILLFFECLFVFFAFVFNFFLLLLKVVFLSYIIYPGYIFPFFYISQFFPTSPNIWIYPLPILSENTNRLLKNNYKNIIKYIKNNQAEKKTPKECTRKRDLPNDSLRNPIKLRTGTHNVYKKKEEMNIYK